MPTTICAKGWTTPAQARSQNRTRDVGPRGCTASARCPGAARTSSRATPPGHEQRHRPGLPPLQCPDCVPATRRHSATASLPLSLSGSRRASRAYGISSVAPHTHQPTVRVSGTGCATHAPLDLQPYSLRPYSRIRTHQGTNTKIEPESWAVGNPRALSASRTSIGRARSPRRGIGPQLSVRPSPDMETRPP